MERLPSWFPFVILSPLIVVVTISISYGVFVALPKYLRTRRTNLAKRIEEEVQASIRQARKAERERNKRQDEQQELGQKLQKLLIDAWRASRSSNPLYPIQQTIFGSRYGGTYRIHIRPVSYVFVETKGWVLMITIDFLKVGREVNITWNGLQYGTFSRCVAVNVVKELAPQVFPPAVKPIHPSTS